MGRAAEEFRRDLLWRCRSAGLAGPYHALGSAPADLPGFDQYANVRPTRILPGIASPLAGVGPGDLDWVIVRENSEGEYSGVGGRTHRGLPEEVGTEVSIFTRAGVTRIMRYAFKLAQSRPRKLLTVVTKSNAQRHGMVMWDEIAAEVAAEYPDVSGTRCWSMR